MNLTVKNQLNPNLKRRKLNNGLMQSITKVTQVPVDVIELDEEPIVAEEEKAQKENLTGPKKQATLQFG